jgi:hypothetical protein
MAFISQSRSTLPTPRFVDGAGRWLLQSGIQEANGGVARYYRSDTGRNHPVSTEITGYAVSTLVYLYQLTGHSVYLERAVLAARFLTRQAWDCGSGCMPFEYGALPEDATPLAYFFDCGIITRGLVAAWRATGEAEFLEAAVRCGRSMLCDFASGGEFHPVLALPSKCPVPCDERWSRSKGCYQLKSAMAWHDLAEATGERAFRAPYLQVLENSLESHHSFLPGPAGGLTVVDRLHAYAYFLEGLLPCAQEPNCVTALREGIDRMTDYLEDVGPRFERCDVFAQLLRLRIFADWMCLVPIDQKAAAFEAFTLLGFQQHHPDPRVDGGFGFGRRGRDWLPFVNPVSTGFSLQALAMWQQHLAGEPRTELQMLI